MLHSYLKRRNTPIATLIKRFVDKKSGKVVDSRYEIQRRFDYLDWKDQKKILFAFLESGKTDRQWAYMQFLKYWDKAFEPKVKELWEQLHEEKCAWVVIRHFPVEYISQNIATFTNRRDYFFICLRLAQDKNYVIEKEKLSYKDYLAVLYHTGRTIDPDEAEDILYKTVHRICMTPFPDYVTWILERYADTSVGSIIRPVNFNPINIVLYYIRKLNCSFVVQRFEDWNTVVHKNISVSPEYKKLLDDGLTDEDYKICMMKISRRYAYLALPDRYKKPTDPPIEEVLYPKDDNYAIALEERNRMAQQQLITPGNMAVLNEMLSENPFVGDLIGKLDLEEEPPF